MPAAPLPTKMPEIVSANATPPVTASRRRHAAKAALPTPFVVVFTRRSGSTWVCDMLGSHPDVRCEGELFAPTGSRNQPLRADVPYFFDTVLRGRRPSRKPGAMPGSGLGRPIRGWRYADSVFQAERGTRAVGCKVSYAHFKHVPWLLAYIASKRIPVVHLVRRNKLDHLLSLASAKARGQYHALAGERVENPPVELQTQTLIASLAKEERRVRRAQVVLSLLRVPVIDIAYEDLLLDHDRFRAIIDFLGVDPGFDELHSKLQKWNRSSQQEAIANYEDVRATLQGTRYELFLEATGTGLTR